MQVKIELTPLARQSIQSLSLERETYAETINRLLEALGVFMDVDNFEQHFGEQVRRKPAKPRKRSVKKVQA